MSTLDRQGTMRVWDAARSLAAPATIPEIQKLAGATHQTASRRLRFWADRGLLRQSAERPARYAIARSARALEQAPAGGELSGTIWAFMRRAGKPVTFAEIVAATATSDRSAYCRLFRFIQLGAVTRLPATPARFVMTEQARLILEPPVPEPPRSKPRRIPTQRARLWAVMRVLKEFDVPLLVMTAEVNRRACDDFISALGRAGYVKAVQHRMRRHKAGTGGFCRDFTTYRLVRNTGPKAPIVSCPATGGRVLIDPNTGERFPLVSRRRDAEVNHVR